MKNDKYAISIIVPVYNVQKYLAKCLDSLVHQTLKDIEIILVDDGSNDQSGYICDQYACQDSRVKVIHQENIGAGLARNRGLAIAQGEFIAFVDSDDRVSIRMCERLYMLACKHNADAVLGRQRRFWNESEVAEDIPTFDDDIAIWRDDEIRQYVLNRIGLLPDAQKDSLHGASMCGGVFRRSIIEASEIRYESERNLISEDGIFNIDLLPMCKTIIHCNDILYYYRYNPASLTTTYKAERFEMNVELYHEMYRRLEKRYTKKECFHSMSRYFLTFTRVALIQEITHVKSNGFSHAYQNIKRICNNSELQNVINQYPFNKMPLKYGILFWAIKKKWYSFIWGILVLHQVKKQVKAFRTH